jgi:alkanesulfonate monooxygenase SsuD/methylene tetrahydromethanopterin reductase-like flavin-dependent oxidoreductase (luciferase family)
VETGIILGDVRTSVPPREHLRDLLVQVEAAQRNGFTYIAIGQHFLYGDFRWLQPIPTLARLAGELDAHVRLAATVIIVPLYHPVVLAEELATLDIVSEGRLVVGAGLGYRKEEFRLLGIDFAERVPRFEEALELIVQLWTADRVTHAGRFWTLEDATTHLRPVQQPHPPLWLGAHSDVGVRRAARLGSTWMIPAECPLEDVRRWIGLFQETRAAHGLPPADSFPIRRELAVGRDREDALRLFERSASGRYQAYAARERAWAGTEAELSAAFAEQVADHLVAGSPEECVAELSAIAESVPVGPMIFRPSWPDMTSDEVVAYLDELGREVVPALRALA